MTIEPLPPSPSSWVWDGVSRVTTPVLTSQLPSVSNVTPASRTVLPVNLPFFGTDEPPSNGWVLADKLDLGGVVNYLFVGRKNGKFYFRFSLDDEGQLSSTADKWSGQWLEPVPADEARTPIAVQLDATSFPDSRQNLDIGGLVARYSLRDEILKYEGKWVTNVHWDLLLSFSSVNAQVISIWMVQIDGYYCFYHTIAAPTSLVNHAEYTYTGRPAFSGALPFVSDPSAGAARPSPAQLNYSVSSTAFRRIITGNNFTGLTSDTPLSDDAALAQLAERLPEDRSLWATPTYINNGSYRTLFVLVSYLSEFETYNMSQSFSHTLTYPRG